MRSTNRLSRLGLAAVAGALALGVVACDTESIVDLPDPDLITLPIVLDPDNAETVRNGAYYEFARAIAGPSGNNETPGVVGIGGLLTDELWYSSSFDSMKEIDRRDMFNTNNDVFRIYRYLHRARNLSEEAEILLAEAGGSPDQSRLMSLSAFTYVYFAENWCSNVPFSKAPLGEQIEYAPAIGMEAMLDSAIVKFDEAIQLGQNAGAAEFVTLARLGKARALQNKGDLAGAAAVAAQVPAGYTHYVEYSPNAAGQNNGVWYNINSERRSSAASGDGINGIRFFDRGSGENVVDPRVLVDSLGTGSGSSVVSYGQFKYESRGADVPLASYTEAQLIIAEADLNGGSTAGSAAAGNWLAILNDLRADMGLEALMDPEDPKDRVLMLYEERAFWLWLTGHRLGDLRRLLRIDAYAGMFTADELFPIGPTIFNASRGDHVAFPVPFEEVNNPEYTDAGCDVTQP